MKFRVIAARLFLTLLPAAGLAQAVSDAVFNVDLENFLIYINDVGDPRRLATSPKATFSAPQGWAWAFQQSIVLADVVAVASQPAKGLFVARETRLNASLDPLPGRVLADTPRVGIYDFAIELLQANGEPVGTLVGVFLGGGSPPPGAPAAFRAGNYVITGGSGAFLGARGQAAINAYSAMSAPGRDASMTEDPAFRRVNGGGYRARIAVQLVSVPLPEVAAAYHADFSSVTVSKPARPGESLILAVKGLGPTRPGLEPGQVFTQNAIPEVTSPVEVVVGDTPVEIGNRVGWPGTRDTYRLDVRLPAAIPAGIAPVKVTAAWITGSAFGIPVQQ
jgi:uncharacterized protein (TIGR03437 family)